mmetsp:Transcript_57309/g.117273  ORF Transcript_57309/g.117273 Transcript_57309/m.117273 type:complete len:128 (+) Transcript_57309:253-636(+)
MSKAFALVSRYHNSRQPGSWATLRSADGAYVFKSGCSQNYAHAYLDMMLESAALRETVTLFKESLRFQSLLSTSMAEVNMQRELLLQHKINSPEPAEEVEEAGPAQVRLTDHQEMHCQSNPGGPGLE